MRSGQLTAAELLWSLLNDPVAAIDIHDLRGRKEGRDRRQCGFWYIVAPECSQEEDPTIILPDPQVLCVGEVTQGS
jgi:hypothetical protein